jgi:DTW domain-containing protein
MPELPGFEPRSICPRCRRPETVCYCQYLTRIETKTHIVLLQHPRERDMAIGTARMASLCLPNSQLLVGFDWENSNALKALLADPERPAALLYPGADAVDLQESPPSGPITLVVVDGTWANTKKMVRANPVLSNLPKVAFRPLRPSEYRIRREPHAQFVSTIEALMYVLGALEGGSERFAGLLLPFRKMVDNQLECKARRCSPRSRHKLQPRQPRSHIPEELRTNAGNIVCVVGEANAWPCRDLEHRSAYPDELVQWVALRPATGERFECFAAPRNPLSPSTPAHLSVDASTLHAGGTLASLLEGWRQFFREDDIICSWGRYATALFVRSGGTLPSKQFDLRLVAKDELKRNIGTMEEFYASLATGPSEPLAPGRAGVRLGQLAKIAAFL